MRKFILAAAAAATMTMSFGTSASAVSYTSYCEDTGASWAGGAHPGRCGAGDVSVGGYDVTNFNAGSFGSQQGLIFKGYGDNGDLDSWTFTAAKAFGAHLDLFQYSGVGRNTNNISAFLTDALGNVISLTSKVAPAYLGQIAAGTYTLSILGNPKSTNMYDYNLRVQAVPLPAGALLLGTALVGMGALRRRKASKA